MPRQLFQYLDRSPGSRRARKLDARGIADRDSARVDPVAVPIEPCAQTNAESRDRYKAGVEITQVQLQTVYPRARVIESFRDVQRSNTEPKGAHEA